MEGLIVAFGLGLASAVSPCLLPLYPAFLAYLTSAVGAETGSRSAQTGSGSARRVSGFLGLAVLFGVLTTMIGIGVMLAVVGVPLGQVLGYAIPIIDAILVLLGILLLLGRNPFLKLSTIKVPVARGPVSQAYVYGIFLGPIALPCAGAFLVATLGVAISIGASVGAAGTVLTFIVYGLGFGLPLVLLSVLARAREDVVVRFLARHHRAIEIVSGVLLIIAGIADFWISVDSILLTFDL